MRRLLFQASLVVLIIAGYLAAPFVTAWSIREAVRNGDSAYLETRIDWPSVRKTLAPAIGRITLNLPDPDAAPLTKPGLWQRFKAYWGQGAVNRAIESYVTPEGLPQLFAARKAYRKYVSGEPDDSTIPIIDRIKRAWARVKRAEFTSMTEFEIDMVDKHDPDRMYLGKLVVDGFSWKLKELRVKILTTAQGTIQRFVATGTNDNRRSVDTLPTPGAKPVSPIAAAPPGIGLIGEAEAAELPDPGASSNARWHEHGSTWTRISAVMRDGGLWARAKTAAR